MQTTSPAGQANPTMKQVAERAGVSMMTVSRVVNDPSQVKPTTRDRVQRAIEALNYRPNIGARHLAGGRSLFIGLVYKNPSPGYLQKILLGSLEACRASGHHLVLEDLSASDPFAQPESTVRALNLSGLDGVIVTPPLSAYPEFIAALERSRLPVIRVAPADIREGGLAVSMDDARAMGDLIDHLVALGHRSMGFIAGPRDHIASEHRMDGFQRAMQRHGLSVSAEYRLEGDFTYRSGFLAGEALLQRPKPPSVIVASNDDMAAGAIMAAYRLGYDVPGDISVVGFDDTEMATNVWPPLTTVRQPITAMASQAVQLLEAHLRGDNETAETLQRLVSHELVLRDSTAAPKRASLYATPAE